MYLYVKITLPITVFKEKLLNSPTISKKAAIYYPNEIIRHLICKPHSLIGMVAGHHR